MTDRNTKEILKLPLLALRGVVIFPNNVTTLDVGREKSVAAVEQAVAGDRKLFAVAQNDASVDTPGVDDLHQVGTVIEIKQVMSMPDHTMRLLVKGEMRAILKGAVDMGNYYTACYELEEASFETCAPDGELLAGMRVAKAMTHQLVAMTSGNRAEFMQSVDGESVPSALFDRIANGAFDDVEDKQEILECFDLHMRLEAVLNTLGALMSIKRLEDKIQQRVHEAMDRANHEYYLREQINAIHDELGENDDEEIVEYRRKLARSKMPDEAREKVEREIKRLARTAAQSPEASVSQNYIEYMLELPWGIRQESEIDIEKARTILEEDHFGMRDVKDRLLEFLAVRKTTDNAKSPIICLVGPPGVGKTSIAKSVARALDRKFVQMSLGGVHDEAEVRGHRKTYVGAMPGRIVTSIRRCETMNPVFLLDEIDKIAHDMRGDPAAALLEALDPEQNKNFRDHYIEAPIDLSDVLFITTANSTEPIDHALLDRMEIIEVKSYTLEEKCSIAEKYLFPKQLKAHGLKKSQLRVSKNIIAEMIDGYTREAGVRNLERTVEKVCRKAVLYYLDHPEKKSVTLNEAHLREWLGGKKFLRQAAEEKASVGIVNGLAWTSVGGEVMPVEAVVLPGKGGIEITGKLGDVMQESVRVARTLTRARSTIYGVPADFFEKNDIHLHVPEGAVPKDGPSAGTAITCALISAVAGIPARNDIAMTGEVTLHGRVLPIGGVREKLLAAYRMGITNILLPKENEKDLEDIDPDILSALHITLLSNVDEALAIVLVKSDGKGEKA